MDSHRKAVSNLLELAHRLDLEVDAWANEILCNLQAVSTSKHIGVAMATVFPSISNAHFIGTGAFASSGLPAMIDRWSPETNLYLMSQGHAFWWKDASDHAAEHVSHDQQRYFRDTLEMLQLSDIRLNISFDPSANGAILSEGFDLSSGVSRPPEPVGWAEVTSHVGAAWRLRSLLAQGEGKLEAVLDPDGHKVQHAEGPALDASARDSLRHAARSVDRARSRRAIDPLNELLARQVMVQGRWSLIDQFDADGKHMIFARVNDPIAPETVLPTLSPRERQVALYVALGHSLKLIGYELGLAPSTVSGALHRALRKLGLHGAPQLAKHVRAIVVPVPRHGDS